MKNHNNSTFMFQYMILFFVFISSLHSFYSYTLTFPVVSVVGVFGCAILMLVANISKIDISIARAAFSLIFFYILALFWSVLAVVFYNDDVKIDRVMGFIAVVISTFVFSLVLSKLSAKFLLSSILAAHAIFFYTQFVLYYGFSISLDPLELVMGYKQSGWGGSFEHEILGDFVRFGGLYNEPGTYATFMAPLLALFARYRNFSRMSMLIFWGSYISLILTFSVFAFLFVIIITLFVFRQRAILTTAFIAPIIFMIVLPYIEYRFITFSSAGHDSGINSRIDFINNIAEYLSYGPVELLLGTGFLSVEFKIESTGAVNDIGLFIYLIATTGFFFSFIAIVLFVYYTMRGGRSCFAAALIVLFSKISLFAPFFPFIIIMIFSERIQKVSRINEISDSISGRIYGSGVNRQRDGRLPRTPVRLG